MPRHHPTFRKHHRPGNVCGPAKQFSIDEIADASESESDRSCGATQVRNVPEIPTFLSCDVEGGEQHADESSVKRHTALPDGEYGKRSAHIAAQIVKEDVAKPAADHDSENQVEQGVVQIVGRDVQLAIPGEAAE